MYPWEVTYADSRSETLTRRLLTSADVEAWVTNPATAVVIVAPPDYAAEIAGVLAVAQRTLRGTPQHAGRELASYVPARGHARYVRGKYERADRAEVGVRALVVSARFRRWKGVFLLEALRGVAEGMLRRADRDLVGAEFPSDRDGVAEYRKAVERQIGPVPVPASLVAAFVGQSPAAHDVRRSIVLAARTTHPVLIRGETGTGKEVVAREIHRLSSRAAEPFVVVNCAAITSDLVEAELFGHVKGAFAGAVRGKEGLYAAATDGTLFLDEIGALPLQHQAKVLRILDGGYYCNVGTNKERRGNARIIAATCRNLLRLVRAGRFSDDLYFRLQSWRIQTPALRDHADDIPELARHFWSRICWPADVELPAAALSLLKDYAWNGNARELRAFLEELETNTIGRPPPAELLRAALRAWQGRAEPRDYSWAAPEFLGDR